MASVTTTKNKISQLKTTIIPDIVTGKRFTVEVPVGIIDEDGRDIINDILYRHHKRCLPESWDYRVQVPEKGEYVGSFCKRLAKFYYQEYRIKLVPAFLGQIGAIISEHVNTNSIYTIDYTRNFDWVDGDFGDGGSCFWGENSGALTALEEHGAYAIRFYEGNNGFARAWVVPYCITDTKHYIVFNGYGMSTQDIARIMAFHLGLSYRRISLTNNREQAGLIWINGCGLRNQSGGTGFLLGYEHTINGINYIDMEIESNRCCDCGDYICEDIHEFNNNLYCDYCYDNNVVVCDNCDENYYSDDICSIKTEDGNIFICEKCYDNYTKCNNCDCYIFNDQVIIIDCDNICQTCIDREYIWCSRCKTYTHEINIEDNICPNCNKKYKKEIN